MSKQDRQGVRTPADLERKYDLGAYFADNATDVGKLSTQLNQLISSFSQYVATTNATIAALENNQNIEIEINGENIVLSDSSSRELKALTIYGKTTQDGTPTPEAPTELVSAGAGGEIVITVSGENDIQTIAVSTPEGLRGIKLDEGYDGNYTDTEGNTWICDEIDFARGVHIKRIGCIDGYVFDGQGYSHIYMSSTGMWSDGASIIYPLDEPIETALTSDELNAYANLHTYYTNTAISSDAECDLKVGYIADIKSYIDNRTMN